MHARVPSPKILVMGDEVESQIFLSTLLSAGGFASVGVTSESEGLQWALEMRPALIILDGTVLRFGGVRIYEALKHDERLKHIPVIMLSAVSHKAYLHYQQIHATDAGLILPSPEALLERPPEADELLRWVGVLTGKNPRRQPSRSPNDRRLPATHIPVPKGA